jgi:hypothetical protein
MFLGKKKKEKLLDNQISSRSRFYFSSEIKLSSTHFRELNSVNRNIAYNMQDRGSYLYTFTYLS